MTNAASTLFLPRARAYARLMRFDRPVGTLLLLWPTLAALWLAAGGVPASNLIAIFTLGTIVMRAAGCVINDFADREFDGHVRRTSARPLATGQIGEREALVLFVVLLFIALGLVLMLNVVTQRMAVIGAALAVLYPFMKRWTYLPQVVLGLAFSWAILMAFTATGADPALGEAAAFAEVFGLAAMPNEAWLLFVASVLWIVAYDTLYAMVDRPDDLKAGIKSTAILFGSADRFMVGLLQLCSLLALVLLGLQQPFGVIYFGALAVMAALFGWQQWLIRRRDLDACFRAFGNNVWVGFALLAGVALELALAG
jgi:4-hydroxybenzoate polyprenyltransferase